MARGRKSEASSLTVVPMVPGQGRPKPPAGLDKLERRILEGCGRRLARPLA